MKPRISVVIPTYRRPQLLRRCLEVLLLQDADPAGIEIVVVDDGRSDEVQSLIEKLAAGQRNAATLRYLQPPAGKRGPAAARNAGWQAAAGEIIAFTDDDTIPMPHWLSAGLAAMQPAVAAAWGRVRVPLPDKPTDAERNIAGLDGAEFVTANCFVRRSVLAELGGFDERFRRAWREDSDLYFSLLEGGWTVVSAPAAIVVHPARQTPATHCLRLHGNLFFDALLYKKHRQLYREKIAAWPPLDYYLTVLLLLFAVAALAGGQFAGAGLAAVGWLALTLRLAWRRQQGLSPAWRERAGIVLTSALIPPLAVFWRLAGAWHFRVGFA
ncbi:MAG: glycosyltransferase family 2 protein [Bacteroidota bacterium]